MKSKTCFGKESKEPLSVYKLRREAKESAEFIKKKFKKEMSPYKCDKCGQWHLALASRLTPSKTCKKCNDSRGKPKEAYKTKKGAIKRAELLKKEMGVKLQVYKCPHGAGWHLTKGLNKYK